MSLSDLIFVFGFFPIFFAFYYLSQNKYRKYILLVGSIFFYYVSDPNRIWVIAAMTVLTYFIALLLCRIKSKENSKWLEKLIFWVGVLGNLIPLFYYRYLNFTLANVGALFHISDVWQKNDYGIPLGISFITFSAISYLADVYNERIKAEHDFISFASYIWMFPKIIMGPIERYDNIAKAFDNPDISIENTSYGIKRFIVGFCKKIIIADNLSIIVNHAFSQPDYAKASTPMLWLGSICFSLELFYDFAGYSDMAIGLASIFGFHFKENFDYPYISKSITEFWRRWHISLSTWFRDYVYIPLGGSRKSFARNVLNLLAVWILTGIWHGAGYKFVVWGLVYFVMLIIERYVIKLKSHNNVVLRYLWMVITLFVINFNWVIFHAEHLKNGIVYCLSMVGYYGFNNGICNQMLVDIREYWIYLLSAIVFATPIAPYIAKETSKIDRHGVLPVIEIAGYLFAFIWALSFVLLGAHNPFIYQQF